MMSSAKADALLQGQTGLARKVYEATPIREAWTVGQIKGAMKEGGSVEHRAIVACLKDMREAGLVREVSGIFQRTEVRAKPIKNETKEVISMAKTETPKAEQPSSMDMLSDLSSEIIDMAEDFGARLKRMAARVEEVALGIELEREATGANLAKLTQLQAILKSLS